MRTFHPSIWVEKDKCIENWRTLTYVLYGAKSSWEVNRFSASQEIPHILWNPNVHYRIHKCPPPFSILSQLDPVHAPHPSSWRTILILSSHLSLGLPSGFLPSGFATKTLYTPQLSPIHATCPAHLILLDFITRTILGEGYRSLNFSIYSFLHSPVTSYLLDPQHPILQHPRPRFLHQCEPTIKDHFKH